MLRGCRAFGLHCVCFEFGGWRCLLAGRAWPSVHKRGEVVLRSLIRRSYTFLPRKLRLQRSNQFLNFFFSFESGNNLFEWLLVATRTRLCS